MCAESPRWRRRKRYFIFYSAVERKLKSWTRSVISAQNNDAVQPGTPRGSACLLVAALIGKLSNTKQKALNQQTTVPELWSRIMSFVCLEASVVSWAHCWSAWFVQHEDPRNQTFSSVFQETPCPGNSRCSPVPGGWAAHTKGNQVENMASEKRMLKALYWQHFTSLLQTSPLLWCCPLLLIPAGGTMPEFVWLSPFFFWVCWAL